MSLSPTAKGEVVPLVSVPRAVTMTCVRPLPADGGVSGSKSTDVSPAVTEPVGHCRWAGDGAGACTGAGATVWTGGVEDAAISGGDNAGLGVALRVGNGMAVGLAAGDLTACEDVDCIEVGVKAAFPGSSLPDSMTPEATAPAATARAKTLRTTTSQIGNFRVPKEVIYGV